MPKINILPAEIASLISAGEVVERPASIVKELVENSIDAGAKKITVEIKNGGVSYIRVADDGCGISSADIRAAFISHATSKITTAQDLDRILTLGFRGEALASIAAVSRVSVLTKTHDDEFGVHYSCEGGTETGFEEAGCPDGTTIIVRDIFFNTPARAKFLKKDVTEGNYIEDCVNMEALAHTEISFRMIKDGREVLFTEGRNDLLRTIGKVFTEDFASELLECELTDGSLSVSGYISKPAFSRPNRSMQYYFVNGRYVRLPSACAALDAAYKHCEMVGKYPACVLMLTMPPVCVDVNVHPAKTEVRFSDEKSVFDIFYSAVRSVLFNGYETIGLNISQSAKLTAPALPSYTADRAPSVSGAPPQEAQTAAGIAPAPFPEAPAFAPSRPADSMPPVRAGVLHDSTSIDIVCDNDDQPAFDGNDGTDGSPEAAVNDSGMSSPHGEEPSPEAVCTGVKAAEEPDDRGIFDDRQSLLYLGEAFRTYLIAQYGSGIIVMDKHAAHERMIFNRLKKEIDSGVASQYMMPVNFVPSRREYSVLMDNIELLENSGYLIEDFGGGTVTVRGCPSVLVNEDIPSLLCEIAGNLMSGSTSTTTERLEKIISTSACRAAVKAGSEMSPAEAQIFMKKVLSDPDIRTCPHGRPVYMEISRHDLEKQFGRLG